MWNTVTFYLIWLVLTGVLTVAFPVAGVAALVLALVVLVKTRNVRAAG